MPNSEYYACLPEVSIPAASKPASGRMEDIKLGHIEGVTIYRVGKGERLEAMPGLHAIYNVYRTAFLPDRTTLVHPTAEGRWVVVGQDIG